MARRKGDPAFHALTPDKPDVANLVGEEIAGLDQLTDSPLRDAEAFGHGDDGQKARSRGRRILKHSANSIDAEGWRSRPETIAPWAGSPRQALHPLGRERVLATAMQTEQPRPKVAHRQDHTLSV